MIGVISTIFIVKILKCRIGNDIAKQLSKARLKRNIISVSFMKMAMVFHRIFLKPLSGIVKQPNKDMLKRKIILAFCIIKVKALNRTTKKRLSGIARQHNKGILKHSIILTSCMVIRISSLPSLVW